MHRKIVTKNNEDRVETGALQVNEDWKGLFIRGDDCIQLHDILKKLLAGGRIDLWEEQHLRLLTTFIEDEVLR